jgi:hypothetical protein
MKAKWMYLAVALLFAGATGVMAASVTPETIDPWQSGDANVECAQANQGTNCGEFAHKVDNWGAGGKDGTYEHADATITISDSDGKTFDWSISDGYSVCAVIVKGGDAANIYYYPPGTTSDSGLVAPPNTNTPDPADTFDISHVSFCFSKDDDGGCFKDETAWAAGPRYTARGNWATYTPYPGNGESVNIYAGQNIFAGTATFAESGGLVAIAIDLGGGCRFTYDAADPLYDNNLKIQDYLTAPSGNPAPGLFLWKFPVPAGATSFTTPAIPKNNFYGIHLDVECPVDCPPIQ